MSFLVRKVIAFNEHHQKKALHRAKMMVRNILPDEIIPMYVANLPSSRLFLILLLYRLQRKGSHHIAAMAHLVDEITIMFVNITSLNDITSHLYLTIPA